MFIYFGSLKEPLFGCNGGSVILLCGINVSWIFAPLIALVAILILIKGVKLFK